MNALQPTFMLPPNFRFPPGGRIQPGIVLDEGSNGLPDPGEVLSDDVSQVNGLDTTDLPYFHHSSDERSNQKLGLWADIVSLVEIGLGGERGHNSSLVVHTGAAKISAFSPSKAYISQLMGDPFLAEYTKRPKRRPVYLVTGVMVAENAIIEVQKGRNFAYQAKIVVNGEGVGVPVKAGPEFEHDASTVGGHTWDLTKPFVLAYAVKKIRRKVLGGLSSKDDNSRALWNDTRPPLTDDEWEVEDFTQEIATERYGNVRQR